LHLRKASKRLLHGSGRVFVVIVNEFAQATTHCLHLKLVMAVSLPTARVKCCKICSYIRHRLSDSHQTRSPHPLSHVHKILGDAREHPPRPLSHIPFFSREGPRQRPHRSWYALVVKLMYISIVIAQVTSPDNASRRQDGTTTFWDSDDRCGHRRCVN